MPSIAKIHEKLLDRLVKHRKNNPKLYFMPRKINNKGRMEKGYWFLGDEAYVYVSLWQGVDWKERVSCIGFVVLLDRSCYIELSGQGASAAVPFLEKVAELDEDFVRLDSKNKWFKYFPSKDNDQYLNFFDDYITNFKPKVDSLIDKEKPPLIYKITEEDFHKHGTKVINSRNTQKVYSEKNKITRLSWNTNNWQYPSGWLGKSNNQDNHEGMFGFGHEEWLFDRSRIIDEYYYGFIKGFELKTEKHVGKIYNVHLYTQNDLRKYFYVGCIRNCEGISKRQSTSIFNHYKEKGWLEEISNSLKKVGARITEFDKSKAELFFNVRFKQRDIELESELIEIAEEDDNITTDRFKLLGFRGNYIPALNPIEVDEKEEDNFKNTNKRKRTFNIEQEFDPIHDKMQNAIFKHLREDTKYKYKKVYIEKSRVDIMAVNLDDSRDYFEIKTDSPRLSIRKAIGQVMEYAYYPDVEKARKIIVVSDNMPDNEAITYLKFLRHRFQIPIYYRFFDWYKLTLSDDF